MIPWVMCRPLYIGGILDMICLMEGLFMRSKIRCEINALLWVWDCAVAIRAPSCTTIEQQRGVPTGIVLIVAAWNTPFGET